MKLIFSLIAIILLQITALSQTAVGFDRNTRNTSPSDLNYRGQSGSFGSLTVTNEINSDSGLFRLLNVTDGHFGSLNVTNSIIANDVTASTGSFETLNGTSGALGSLNVTNEVNADSATFTNLLTAKGGIKGTKTGINSYIKLTNSVGNHFFQIRASETQTTDYTLLPPDEGFEGPVWLSGSNPYKITLYVITNVFSTSLSDESTALTTGTKFTWYAPYALTIKDVRIFVTTASSSGNPTVDIQEDGTTIFTTKISIDSGELTSVTAATPYVLSDANIADNAKLTFIVSTAGTDTTGLKITLYTVKR